MSDNNFESSLEEDKSGVVESTEKEEKVTNRRLYEDTVLEKGKEQNETEEDIIKDDKNVSEKRVSEHVIEEEVKLNNEEIVKKDGEEQTENKELMAKDETDGEVTKEEVGSMMVPTEEDVLRLLKEIKTATSEIKNIVKIEISLKPESLDVIDFGDLTPDSELYVTSSLCSECASEENEKDASEKEENDVIPSATSKTNETHSTSTETKKRWASIKRLLLFTTSRKKNK